MNVNIGSWPCNGERCKKCPFVFNGSCILINNKPFHINSKLTCNSTCVIYVITCLQCNLHYIGQTMNPLRIRLGQHLSDIRLEKPTSVANHFNEHRGTDLHHLFRIAPILYVPDLEKRKCLEMKFINLFKTLSPMGLNERFDPYNLNDNILPIVIPYSEASYSFAMGLKELSQAHNIIYGRTITPFKRSKNLAGFFDVKI